MFTGIITNIGIVESLERKEKDLRLTLSAGYDTANIAIGASIMCNGACLTVIEKGKNLLKFDVSYETLDKTTLGAWQVGTKVNLEQSMKADGEFGGHIVTGHVDGVAKITSRTAAGESADFRVAFPPELKKFIAAKGSVTLNGVALTVNEVEGDELRVTIIPHTLVETNLGDLQPGDELNIEVDIIARYVARMLEVK